MGIRAREALELPAWVSTCAVYSGPCRLPVGCPLTPTLDLCFSLGILALHGPQASRRVEHAQYRTSASPPADSDWSETRMD